MVRPRSEAISEGVHELAVLVLLVAGPVERDGAVGAGGLARLEHLLGRRPDALADLARARRAAELATHLLTHPVDLDRQLLEVARYAHRPALVTEVTLELAEDGGDGEGRERGLAGGIEALDRLQQAERRDLDQVVEGFAGPLVAAGELARERQEALDERLARAGVRVVVVALEKAPVLLRAHEPIGRTGICCWSARLLLGSILDVPHAPPPANTLL